jgi:acyl carrier protein
MKDAKINHMISHDHIQQQLITIVAKSLEIPERNVQLTSSLVNDLDAESIDIMDIRFSIEQQFGFKFNFEEIRMLAEKVAAEHKLNEKDMPAKFTVGSLYDYIIYKLTEKDAATTA